MTVDRETVHAPAAPEAAGPYSHAVRAGNLLFCSGQVPTDPDSGALREGDVAGQVEQCLKNLASVCEAAGASLSDSVRTTVYLTDMADFPRVNEVYAAFFADEPPARVAIAVAALPLGARIEVDAVVALPA